MSRDRVISRAGLMNQLRPMVGLGLRVLRNPLVADVLVVLVVLLLSRISDRAHQETGHDHWLLYFDLALTFPLVWRRRQPFAVFLVIAAIALAQWFSDLQAGADLAVLVALYTVGAHEPRRRVLAAAVLIAEFGVLLAVLRWAPRDHPAGTFILLTGTLTAAWTLGVYRRTRRAYLASVLERAATAERERDQQALIAVASERARISREMHDIVAHSLSVMIALGDGAAATVERDGPAARQAMEQSSALGRQALGEVRRLLGTLQDGVGGDGIEGGSTTDGADLTPQPGIGQLDELVAQVRAAGLAVDLVVDGRPLDLAPGAQLAVYRTVQEALTNVLKHAPEATQATVTLRYGSAEVEIEIQNDDVPGPRRPVGSPASTGHGLAGMRQRAALFDGRVDAARQPDGGWRVVSHLTIPQEPGR